MDDIEINSEGEWLSLVMGSVEMVLWDRDLATDRVRTSANYADFYGLEGSQREWTLAAFLECIVPDDRERVRLSFADALAGRGEYNPQFRKIGRNREVRWCEAKGRIHRSADGTPVRVTGVTWDITSQRAGDERLAHIAKLIPGMVYQYKRTRDGSDSFPYCSNGITQLFGLSPADVQDDAGPLLALVHGEDLPVLLDTLASSARGLTPWRCEYRVLRKDAPERWVLGTANPELQPDGAVLWHGYTKDITQRKLAELAMREVNARLAMALSAARMMTWYWDIDSDAFVSSPSVGAVLGMQDRGYTLTELYALMPADDAAHMKAQFENVAHGGIVTPVTVEFHIALPGAQQRLIECQARRALEPASHANAVIGVAVDITRRRKLEKEREELLLQLRDAQKIETIGMLTGGIAHDFNNVLSSVLGYASLARDRYGAQLPGKLLDYLTEIQRAGERGREMVAQLLAFGRGEQQQVMPTDLPGLVTQTLKMVRSTLPSSIELNTRFDPDLPPAATHPTQFQQILLNLCVNARDAMEGAGQINVALARVAVDGGVCASCGQGFAGEHVLLSVSDGGPGIPESIRKRIFDPFFSTKTARGGTGMGLAMVHGLVHSHGGHLVVESSPRTGSCFKLFFRADTSRGAAAPAVAIPRTAPHFPAPLRILVVDDEFAVAHFFAEALQSHGHHIDVETEPLRALERVCAAPDDYDLVITDQVMPRLSGADLARSILALRPGLPIVLVSGYSGEFGADEALAIGICRFLNKPVTADELVAAVHGAVHRVP